MSNPSGHLEQMLEQVARYAPAAAEGYGRIRTVIDADGALPAAEKALMVAVNAARARDTELLRRELRRASELGAPPRLRAAAASTLLLSRGESAVSLFIAAGEPLDAEAAPLDPWDRDPTDYLREYMDSDTLPPRMTQFAARSPDAFAGYAALHHAALRADRELSLFCELVLCSLNAGDLQGNFVAIHAAGARRMGGTDAQLVEAVLCAIPVGGVGAWAAAAGALFP